MQYSFTGFSIDEDQKYKHIKLIITKGTFQLNGSFHVTVPISPITQESEVFISLNTFKGTPGFPPLVIKKGDHEFIVTGSHGDLSIYNYTVFTYSLMENN